MTEILKLNSIADVVKKNLPENKYIISDTAKEPAGILVRSADMLSYDFPESVLAVARAGAGVNNIPLDVCAEKADTRFEGVYPTICREFVHRLPPQFTLINREEDLGIEGLRKAKLSYCPHTLLHKFTVMTKHPMHRS